MFNLKLTSLELLTLFNTLPSIGGDYCEDEATLVLLDVSNKVRNLIIDNLNKCDNTETLERWQTQELQKIKKNECGHVCAKAKK